MGYYSSMGHNSSMGLYSRNYSSDILPRGHHNSGRSGTSYFHVSNRTGSMCRTYHHMIQDKDGKEPQFLPISFLERLTTKGCTIPHHFNVQKVHIGMRSVLLSCTVLYHQTSCKRSRRLLGFSKNKSGMRQ